MKNILFSGKSFRYRVLEAAAAFLSHQKVYRMDAEKLKAWLIKKQDRRNPGIPFWMRRKYPVSVTTVNGRPLYIISPRVPAKGAGAVLFLHGGGFIFEAHPVHWRAAAGIVDALGIPVWFPAYPLVTLKGPPGDHTSAIEEGAGMVCSVYGRMLQSYESGRIVFLGDSAGACLALIFCHANKAQGMPRPMPGKLVLVSPAMIIEHDQAVLDAMRSIEREGKDVMLATAFMDALAELLQMDRDPKNYINFPLLGNFDGFPAMEVFSGSGDIFYPQMAGFIGRAAEAGTAVNFHEGKGMMHVWPYMPLAPESKASFKKIIRITGETVFGR